MNMQQNPSRAVSIDDTCAGMILAEDLKDAGGAVLLPEGSTLSELSLKSLRRRGIASVCVLSAGQQEEEDEAARAQARIAREQQFERQSARLTRLFRASAGSGATDQLLAHLYAYRRGAPA